MACIGIAQPIIDRQAETGVKDAYTQYWINHLIGCARDIKSQDPLRSSDSILKELREWVTANEVKIYNPFLSHPGTVYSCTIAILY